MRNEFDLKINENSQVLNEFSKNFETLVGNDVKKVPLKMDYVVSSYEDFSIKREARKSFLEKINKTGLKKVAFDTRRIDQMTDRNPRENLQHYHRSDPFITEDFDKKIKQFHKLNEVLVDIEKDYHRDPYYINCYARELREHVKRGLSDGIGDGDYHKSHLSYLEQLVLNRYRLSMNDIDSLPPFEIRKSILLKDETLLRLGKPNSSAENTIKKSESPQPILISTGNQQSSGNDIFGSLINGMANAERVDGKKVQRTITITISDEVL